ncbi:MAG: RsmB/NOP family class I SAM-dependent RNA methyltransferase, partial [Thermoplasmata archaeon]
VELYKNKIITLKKRARRAGAFNIEPMETTDADLAKIKADVVLVDTPCTGTGTFRRNPESRWRLKESDVEELRLKQKEILNTYSKNVKEGGRLVYSTCSVLRQENEDIIEDFLKDGKFKLLNVKEFLPMNCNSFIRNGYFRAYPHIHDTDGFFAAVLEKVR